MNQNIETKATVDSDYETRYVLHRRFDRMGRLIGDDNMKKLFNARVLVLGLGGVGSWAAESLARSGVGHLFLVDFDDICITNTNRQLHAMAGMVGKKKSAVMCERLKKINPQSEVIDLALFYNAENCEKIFSVKPDYVIDAIDNLTAKAHLINECRLRGIPVVSSTGAAARLDPTQVKLADLSASHTDPMAAQLRKILRTKYEFPREGEFGIPCVFSEETHRLPKELHYDEGKGFQCVCPQGENNMHSCDRRNVIYGNASFVTGTFGLVMASWVVRKIIGEVTSLGNKTNNVLNKEG